MAGQDKAVVGNRDREGSLNQRHDLYYLPIGWVQIDWGFEWDRWIHIRYGDVLDLLCLDTKDRS